jgi:glutamine synthetase
MNIMTEEEADARAEVMWENYNCTLAVEVSTFLDMVETGIIPAAAQDLAKFAGAPQLAGKRAELYVKIKKEADILRHMEHEAHEISDLPAEATHWCDVAKPQMQVVRELIDEAEVIMSADLYPYPKYDELVYSHHFTV